MIVGVGASAGSPDSLERMLSALSPSDDFTIVITLQRREALDEARLRAAVRARFGADPVAIENDSRPEAGKVYLAPPNVILTVRDGRLETLPAQQAPGERGTIDSFFISLADDLAERAIGVVLHGTGADGTLGVTAIKERGGLTMAEPAPGEAGDLSMSNSARAVADFILTADGMAESVQRYARHLARLSMQAEQDALVTAAAEPLAQIAVVLRNKTGHDFHGYKQNTFLRRVQRRMQVVQAESITDYVDFLRSDPQEYQSLFNDLLIGVTHFFRDGREYEALEKTVIPDIVRNKVNGEPLRVWVLGCATGEEAYSIAILLREHIAKMERAPQVQIFATDIDGRALASARVGRYPETIKADLTPERLARWFIKEGNTYSIVKELREMCIFSAHNVIRDPPFSRIDLISCRNLLIYLGSELQSRVIPLFHFSLLPGGYLFLGTSENVTRHPKLFAPIDRRSRIFRRLDGGARRLPHFPISASGVRSPADRPPPNPGRRQDGGLARRAERIAERYAPAYVITDSRFEVLHFSGRTGRYIDPISGAASLDLLSLVHRDLRLDLRAALIRAAEGTEPVHLEGLEMGANGGRVVVDIAVEPMREDGPNGSAGFVVVFKEGGTRTPPREVDAEGSPTRNEHVQRLESELQLTRERLQATIEELESTNEELKSSNEEYQSLNEELQSANEELETSKEELQSVNEELTTVNGELAHRVHELTRTTSDLKNFLESTQIATLFLDNELRVMNFTPAITQLFHLVETDVGRPIAHIKARIPLDGLQEDARRVLRSLGSLERAVEDPVDRTRYIVRVLPYRSVDNFIAGVVVTFVDTTPLDRAEERQRLLLAELQHRVRNTLAVVRSIARRTAHTSESVSDFAMHLDGRLNAFARTQALVTRDPEGGVDLESLVAEELLAHGAHEGGQIEIGGPQLRLNAKGAETLGLALHELATNGVKYGALSHEKGKVGVKWQLDGDSGDEPSTLVLEWFEDGVPGVMKPPNRRGFGTELLERTLAYELKASTSLDFRSGGLRCTIRIPLDGIDGSAQRRRRGGNGPRDRANE